MSALSTSVNSINQRGFIVLNYHYPTETSNTTPRPVDCVHALRAMRVRRGHHVLLYGSVLEKTQVWDFLKLGLGKLKF